MSAFQITFRGVLPDEALRELAEAMHAKVQARYGTTACCHLALEEAGDGSGLMQARVQLENHGSALRAEGRVQHENAVRAVRAAFEQAFWALHGQDKSRRQTAQRAAQTPSGVLLLFAARKHHAPSAHEARAKGRTEVRSLQASRNIGLSALASARGRG